MNFRLPTPIRRRSLLAGILAGLCLAFGALPGFAQEGMTLEVCLVTAEKVAKAEKPDAPKEFKGLGKFEKVVKNGPFARAFDKFTMIKVGQGKIADGKGVVKLAKVQTITATDLKKMDGGLTATITWQHGKKQLAKAAVKFVPGAPIIIGGPKVGADKIMILVAVVR